MVSVYQWKHFQIIGVGKQLRPRPKLGQHNGLSDLDIAQINSMYYCNDKAMQKSGKLDRSCQPYSIDLI